MPSDSIPPSISLLRQQPLPLPSAAKHHIENLIIARTFALCSFVFFTTSIANWFSPKTVLNENREAAKFPELAWNLASLASFCRSFENFFNDRFAFREQLVARNSLLYLKLFRAPRSQKVLLGKNGFFFYADYTNRPMMTGSKPFTVDQMYVWKSLLEERHYWCKQRGIDYFLLLAPGKSSIYPELLPDAYSQCSRRTRTDQFIDFLKQTGSPVQIIDTRAAVLSGKGRLPLYFKTDSHWNRLGAYYGYKSMIESIRARHPNVAPPHQLSEFVLRPFPFKWGDLARMQGLFGILSETTVDLDLKRPYPAELIRDYHYTENELGLGAWTRAFGFHRRDSNLPSLVMFRDSFARFMIDPFLPDHFSRCSFYWQPKFSKSIVLREKPDIVVQQILERSFYLDSPEI
ncbi:MAG: hypothetical protein C5B53_12035 [Candidatus Melainabacteria bacterium]|nr:MAG: hypothetical protein C5B53_12035 [Candidatus Melainabacteria bacterium]